MLELGGAAQTAAAVRHELSLGVVAQLVVELEQPWPLHWGFVAQTMTASDRAWISFRKSLAALHVKHPSLCPPPRIVLYFIRTILQCLDETHHYTRPILRPPAHVIAKPFLVKCGVP